MDFLGFVTFVQCYTYGLCLISQFNRDLLALLVMRHN